MAKKFNWGIIGPGRIAEKFAAAVQGISGSKIYAIASRSSQNLDSLRKRFRAEIAYNDYEEMAKDPNINAIYISTPHNFHFENAKLCLTHRKPVLVEKPLTVNAKLAIELFALARKNGVFIMEAMWTRFLPIYKEVRKLLDEDAIGKIQLVHSALGFIANRDLGDRLLNPELAGGAILDLGVYNMAASQFVFQKLPEKIAAAGYIGQTGVDEAVNVSMHYGGGALSNFSCTFLTNLLWDLEIVGTKGYIKVHPKFIGSEKATVFANGKQKTIREPFQINGFEYQIQETQKQILNGNIESPLLSHQHTLDNLESLDQIRKIIKMRYPFE